MKPGLLWKLVAIQVPVLLVAVASIWLAIDYLAADYFMVLMERYGISPRESHAMFLEAIHRYMLSASIVALLVGFGLAYLLTRRALAPLTQMIAAAEAIAAGDYSRRVDAGRRDEVGALARSFNRMADNLEQIEQLRRTLIADAAHELRTPLTNIRGYLEALKDGVLPPDDRHLEMLHTEALHLVELTDSLFELARADAARLSLHPVPTPIVPLIDETLALYRPMIERRGITVRTRVEPAAETVRADPDRLRQILRNLYDNALSYAAPHGGVHISVEKQPTDVRVCFANDGPAIAPSDLPYVFERFYRADKSRTRGAGGAGLGLAIVRELVEAHEGEIGIDSRDGCTRVWFRLPDAQPPRYES